MERDLLDRVLADRPPAFALLHRRTAAGAGRLEVLVGTVSTVDTTADIELPRHDGAGPRHDVLAIIPYRQIAERGFAHTDDESPLITMAVTDQAELPLDAALRRLPDQWIELADGHFDIADDAYADIVRRVIADEIGTGAGANFVIARSFVADIVDHSHRRALTFFRRLAERESGAYWTFIVHTGDRTFVGATPERHVSLIDGVASMNPISGTYRYPPSGPTLPEMLDFLADAKETDELYMVVDEELKMMASLCESGVRVIGPRLKEMAHLAHTEYFIEGYSTRDARDILRDTMFAPTVTGSPLESACQVIVRYEPRGRGYYSGVLALIGRDAKGRQELDSAIAIRTADIDAGGRLRLGVGATLVRHSDPASEVAETRAKAAGVLAALGDRRPTRFADHPTVRAALAGRNTNLAAFWLTEDTRGAYAAPELAGRRVLVVDAEDTFTLMLAQQLRSLGMVVTVRRFDQPYSFDGHDIVVMGPGPGDPNDVDHPKIAHLRAAIRTLLEARLPLFAVCLSHQVLSGELGLRVAPRDVPNQGVQRKIDVFGTPERVGFYNTFAAWSDTDAIACPGVGAVEVCRDTGSGEVYALRGEAFASAQFHSESVLTEDGIGIIRRLLAPLPR